MDADAAARARSVTAIDGSPEMLAIAAAREPGPNVRFVEADIFRLAARPPL